MKLRAGLVAVALTGIPATSGFAADLGPKVVKPRPQVIVWNPWMVRVRALGVLPDAGGSSVNVATLPVLSSPSSGLSIRNSAIPELDISYFFTQYIAAELVLGVSPHRITGTGTLANIDVGRTWLLPPTLTLQYHFADLGAFKPYVGAGVNYTVMFDQSPGNVLTPLPAAGASAAITSLSVHNAFGGAAQVGFDYMLDRHWGLNVDAKKLYLQPSYWAVASVPALAANLPVSGTAHINPWMVGGGVTYKF